MEKTEYLMKCAQAWLYSPEDSSVADHYYNCYIAKKDNMVILIKEDFVLKRIIEDIKAENSSDILKDFGTPTSHEFIHFDTLIGRNGCELFIGYYVRIKF